MAVTRSLLDVTELSPAVQKALGPGPGRMMAARGMVPLGPIEQAQVLYQIAHDGDANLATAATATARGLPAAIVAGVVASVTLDALVLDWFAELVLDRATLLEAMILNPAVADETIAMLARRGGSREIDLIAQNEQRLLRYPEIIGALYLNPKARMSTVDRAVELAVRNGVRVAGLAAWDDIERALQGAPPTVASAADDALFARAAGEVGAPVDDSALPVGPDGEPIEPSLDEQQVPIDRMSIPMKMRLASLGNAFARAVLVRDPVKMVALAAIKAPGMTDIEACRYAGNAAISEEVIRYICNKRDWSKLYECKLRLAQNPKTPLPEASKMLPHLRDKDLKMVAKSKGVPTAIAAQAVKLVKQRTPGAAKKP